MGEGEEEHTEDGDAKSLASNVVVKREFAAVSVVPGVENAVGDVNSLASNVDVKRQFIGVSVAYGVENSGVGGDKVRHEGSEIRG